MRPRSDSGLLRAAREEFEVFRRQVPMDRARQDWVYEHAETGRPCRSERPKSVARHAALLAACTLHGPGRSSKSIGDRFNAVRTPLELQPRPSARPNDGLFRSRDAATNSLQSDHRNQQHVRLFSDSAWFAARWAGRRCAAGFASSPQVVPPIPSPCRLRASPSNLAACSGCLRLPDGKVRWQKRFVFPARRMRRGLQFLEDDQLAEIYYERENEYTLAGSIYNGRVTRVLPGMQSAFVDLGLERDAFLYVTDFIELEDQEETDEVEKAAPTAARLRARCKHPQGAPQRAGTDRNGRTAAQERGGRGGDEQGRNRKPERHTPAAKSRRRWLLPHPPSDGRASRHFGRNVKKPADAAGVAVVAAVAAGGRALRRRLRARTRRQRSRTTRRASRIRAMEKIRNLRAKSVRAQPAPQRIRLRALLCFPASRFRSMAAHPAAKPTPDPERLLPPAQVHTTSLPR